MKGMFIAVIVRSEAARQRMSKLVRVIERRQTRTTSELPTAERKIIWWEWKKVDDLIGIKSKC